MGDWFRRADVSVFTGTHTGLPYALDFLVKGRRRLVINNGTAGLGNFVGTTFGVIARLSSDLQPPADSLYGITIGGLRCDALPVRFDPVRWKARFLDQWPRGSPAHRSHFTWITNREALNATLDLQCDTARQLDVARRQAASAQRLPGRRMRAIYMDGPATRLSGEVKQAVPPSERWPRAGAARQALPVGRDEPWHLRLLRSDHVGRRQRGCDHPTDVPFAVDHRHPHRQHGRPPPYYFGATKPTGG